MLADNLIFLRNIKGLTQEQVAEVIGISRQSYSKWEQGKSYPDLQILVSMSNQFSSHPVLFKIK
mgnify:CR=1 FL=1